MNRLILRFLNTPLILLAVVIAIAFQSALFTSWPVSYFQPDFVLLVVMWFSLRRGFAEGGCLTLLVAAICESHSSAPEGLFLISYMSVFLFMRGASRFFVIPNFSSYAMFTLITSVLWKVVGLLVLYLLGASSNQWKHTLTFIFVSASVNALVSLWIYRWLDKFDWATFKSARAERMLDEELLLDGEGY